MHPCTHSYACTHHMLAHMLWHAHPCITAAMCTHACMPVQQPIHTFICTHPYTLPCSHTPTHTPIHTPTHTHLYTPHTPIFPCAHTHVHTHARSHAHIHAFICTPIIPCAHTHTRSCAHTHSGTYTLALSPGRIDRAVGVVGAGLSQPPLVESGPTILPLPGNSSCALELWVTLWPSTVAEWWVPQESGLTLPS